MEKVTNEVSLSQEILIPEISLFELLERSAEKYASKIAVIDREQEYTFQELKEKVEYLASALHEKGFKKEDRLALMVPNSIEYIVTYFAVHRLGGTIVQVNPMYQPQELEHILVDSDATWFVGSIKEKVKLEKIGLIGKLNTIYIDDESGDSLNSLIQQKKKNLPALHIDIYNHVAILQYTGGTTGKPKGVMLTHYNIVANNHQLYYHVEEIYSQPDHRLLGVAPMYHAMGVTNMSLTLMIGGTFIALERFRSNVVIEYIRKYKTTIFLGSPTMYIAILNDETLQEGDLRSFKLLVGGSAPMPIEVINRIKRETDAVFIEGYGQSEATTSTHRNPSKGVQKVGSIGIPIPLTEAKIVDKDNGVEELPVGEAGELIVKGPQVMKGYWNNEEETKNTIRDGWLYTGDLAKKDEDGYYYIVGRKKELIIAGGYNIYPAEIENVLYEHPAVKEACVYGVPHEYRGETVKAAIVPKAPVTEEEITEWCTERLARYKVPKIIEFREELPKSTVGKILRRKLVEEELNKVNS